MRKFKPKLQDYLQAVLAKNRSERGLTQEKMAASLYLTPRAYGDLERGTSGFSAVTLMLFLSQLTDKEILSIIRGFAEILPEAEESV